MRGCRSRLAPDEIPRIDPWNTHVNLTQNHLLYIILYGKQCKVLTDKNNNNNITYIL